MSIDPITQPLLPDPFSDGVPHECACQRTDGGHYDHQAEAQVALSGNEPASGITSSEGIGGNRFSRKVNAATPTYPSRAMTLVIHSNTPFSAGATA
jgi:hypothetical protein